METLHSTLAKWIPAALLQVLHRGPSAVPRRTTAVLRSIRDISVSTRTTGFLFELWYFLKGTPHVQNLHFTRCVIMSTEMRMEYSMLPKYCEDTCQAPTKTLELFLKERAILCSQAINKILAALSPESLPFVLNAISRRGTYYARKLPDQCVLHDSEIDFISDIRNRTKCVNGANLII